MIAVDTSVWIDLFRKADTPQAKYLRNALSSEDDDFALTDVVLTESPHSDADTPRTVVSVG